MSAFIVNDTHLSAIVRYACRNNIGRVPGQEQETIDLLHAENVKSVNYRYKENTPLTGTVYNAFATELTPIEVIKACQCLDYQSYEHPGWGESAACRLLKAIQHHAITNIQGYDAAAWEIEA